MNERFSLEFYIFDKTKPLTHVEKDIWYNLIEDNDLKNILIKLDLKNIKLLNRCEPSISSLDELKQLRLEEICYIYSKDYKHNLVFNQNMGTDIFSFDEIKLIGKKIYKGLVEYMGHDIDEPRIFLNIDIDD